MSRIMTKICIWWLRPGKTQICLFSYRSYLESLQILGIASRYYTIREWITKTLINCTDAQADLSGLYLCCSHMTENKFCHDPAQNSVSMWLKLRIRAVFPDLYQLTFGLLFACFKFMIILTQWFIIHKLLTLHVQQLLHAVHRFLLFLFIWAEGSFGELIE